MKISAEDTIYLTLIATLIVQFLKIVWVGIFKQPKPSAGILRIVVFVVAVAWGYFDAGVEMPVYEDPMQFALALIEGVGLILIVAHNAYEVILKPVLGWLDSKILRRAILAP